jgi:hypothetical protein
MIPSKCYLFLTPPLSLLLSSYMHSSNSIIVFNNISPIIAHDCLFTVINSSDGITGEREKEKRYKGEGGGEGREILSKMINKEEEENLIFVFFVALEMYNRPRRVLILHSLDSLAFPPTLTHIKFRADFNQPVSRQNLPAKIQILEFGTEFDQPVDDLPFGVTTLFFWSNFSQPLDLLPSSVLHLMIGQSNTGARLDKSKLYILSSSPISSPYKYEQKSGWNSPSLCYDEHTYDISYWQACDYSCFPPTLTYLCVSLSLPFDFTRFPASLVRLNLTLNIKLLELGM